MSCSQTSLAVKGLAVKCHLRSNFSNLGCWSRIPRSNVSWGQMLLSVKCPAVKYHLRSNVTWSQMYRGQMSLTVKCPAVKCHLWSNVPWSNVPRSNVICGQISIGVYCPAVKCPRSNVSWSNETVVIGYPIKKLSKGQKISKAN